MKTLLICALVATAAFTGPLFSASANGSTSASATTANKPMMPLVHEALVEDGIGSSWKFYLYGVDTDAKSGEMGYTYGTARFDGHWVETSIDGHKAYELTFDTDKTGSFNTNDGDEMPLTKALIIDYGNSRAYFVTPDSQKYFCEIME